MERTERDTPTALPDADRDRLHDLLETERQLLNAVVRQMPAGVLVVEAPDGAVVFANGEAERLLRHSPVSARSVADYADRWRAFHPDGTPYASAEYPVARSLLEGEVVTDEEILYRRGDGTEAVIMASASPVRGLSGEIVAAVAVFHDVTEQRRTRNELRRIDGELQHQLRTFDTVLSSIEDFVYVFDLAGRFTYANRPMLAAWQTDASRVLGRTFADLDFPPELTSLYTEQIEEVVRTGRPLRAETPFTMPDGYTGHYEYIFAPVMGAAGEVVAVAGVTREVTEQRAAEIERERLLSAERGARKDADSARAEAEAANRAKSEFLATMSHEIRTPINAIIGYVDLLQAGVAGPLASGHAGYVDRIKASSRHLLALVNDVLDLAKIDAGRVQISLEEARVGPVVESALDLVRPQAAQQNLAISGTCEGDPDARFVADPDRVRQILVNLVSNAIKFTDEGGRIRVRCAIDDDGPSRRAVAPRAGRWVYVAVEDTGIGMAPETLDALFEPFVQGETGYTRSRQGTGLGLAISRRLARHLGGDITVASQPGGGSTFTLWLPAAGPAAAEEASASSPVPAADGERITGVAPVGERLRNDAERVVRGFVRRLRANPPAGAVEAVSDATLADHAATMVTDIATSLLMLEDGDDDAAALLRDGSTIQSAIAERHGKQRHRIGWTEAALDEEFRILWEEIEQVVLQAARERPDARPERARDLLEGLLGQARRVSLRAFRVAEREAET
jgi:PAS domain S-box-containing protein